MFCISELAIIEGCDVWSAITRTWTNESAFNFHEYAVDLTLRNACFEYAASGKKISSRNRKEVIPHLRNHGTATMEDDISWQVGPHSQPFLLPDSKH